MAKFDISLGNCAATIGGPGVAMEANVEPGAHRQRLRSDSTRMRVRWGTPGAGVRGKCSQALWTAILACFLGVMPAHADDFVPTRTAPDPPARGNAPRRAFGPSWDLEGLFLWRGPSGAATRIDSQWDSVCGADATVIDIREGQALGALGGSLGAARWTERG